MVVDIDIHRSIDGGLDVRNPHVLKLADSVNSELFAPVDKTLITSGETEDLIRTCYLPSVRQHLTAFDGYGTATLQRTASCPAGFVSPVTATRELLCASVVYFT